MFLDLMAFEAYYHSRQRTLPLFALLFAGLGFFVAMQGYASPQIMLNGPFQIAFHTALFSLACVFPLMFFTVSGVLRDQQYDFGSLIYSTPVVRPQLFWSRYLGIVGFGILAISPFLLGGMLGEIVPMARAASQRGSGALSYYLSAWLWFLVPNSIICGSVIFMVSAWSRNQLATYAAAVGVYALYWLCALFLNAPMLANATPPEAGALALAALADPFGIAAFFEQTQHWTVYQKNNELLRPEGYLLYNRLLWLGISLLLVVWTSRMKPFRPGRARKAATVEAITLPRQAARYLPLQLRLAPGRWWPAFGSVLRIELKYVLGSLPYLAILALWGVIVFTEIYSRIYGGGSYGEQLYPTTGLLLWLIRDPLPWLGTLLLIFYSGELVWRERELRIDSLIYAAPVNTQSLLMAKWLALLVLPLSLMLLSIIIGLGFQLAGGYLHVEPGLYLSLFYYEGLPLLFCSFLALFVQVVSPRKYLGMLLTLLLIILFRPTVATQLGLHHPLLQLGAFPEVMHTDMNGYGDYRKGFHYLGVHWTLLGLLLGALAWQFWPSRADRPKHQWSKRAMATLLLLFTLLTISGTIIYNQVNIQGAYQSPSQQMDVQEAYERKFKKYEQPDRLFPVAVDTQVDLYPEQGAYRVQAKHTMENKSDTIVEEVFVTERIPLTSFELEGGVLVELDTFFQTRLYRLQHPLLPGDTFSYTYELYHQKQGFATTRGLVENGTYLMRNEFDPVLNYRASLEISDEKERAQRGLPPLEQTLNEEASLHLSSAAVGKISFKCQLSTAGNQTAIAPGKLRRHWKKDGRNYYHYQSEQPILPILNYFSARYEVDQSQYQSMDLALYYHPLHAMNIAHIKSSTQLAHDYCARNFGPYPLDHLRIAEIPGHWPFGGQAMPGTISMVENRLYLVDTRAENAFDLVAKRTIHEVAHQWWGGLLSPKNIAGSDFLVEGLAKYTEAVVMEQSEGLGAVWQLSKTANQQYFRERTLADKRESPLFLCQNESYLAYGKGFVAMLGLRELLGEEQVNTALRNLLQQHRCEIDPTLTSLDFLEALYQQANPLDTVLINDWLKRKITYDLSIPDATIRERSDGKYEIKATIAAQRYTETSAGELQAVGLNEPVQVGLFEQSPQYLGKGEKPLYLSAVCVEEGTQQLIIITPHRPTYLIIDPFGSRLEAARDDNRWAF